MAFFEVNTIDLSMNNSTTGVPLTANVYNVDGIARSMSIGELVMAICLKRATELETTIVKQMESMTKTTNNLEVLTSIEKVIVDLQSDGNDIPWTSLTNDITVDPFVWYTKKTDGTYNDDPDTTYATKGITTKSQLQSFLTNFVGITSTQLDFNTATLSGVVQAISSKMDSLNSVSQKETIELQSLTNKRDQSYDLITNMLKSMNTVIQSIGANLGR